MATKCESCPVSSLAMKQAKRPLSDRASMSAYDPKRTSAGVFLPALYVTFDDRPSVLPNRPYASFCLGRHVRRRDFITLFSGAAIAWPTGPTKRFTIDVPVDLHTRIKMRRIVVKPEDRKIVNLDPFGIESCFT
jgi:hypothetical protein